MRASRARWEVEPSSEKSTPDSRTISNSGKRKRGVDDGAGHQHSKKHAGAEETGTHDHGYTPTGKFQEPQVELDDRVDDDDSSSDSGILSLHAETKRMPAHLPGMLGCEGDKV